MSFEDLIRRQLDLFEQECAGLIADCDAAERAYDAADRDEAEERYGDYLDLVETRHGPARGAPRRVRLDDGRGHRRGLRGGVQPDGPGAVTAVRARNRERLTAH